MIDRQDLEALKQGVDLIALVESRGIELTKNGKGYVGLCPFHEDVNPSLSVNPGENLWKCFGCGAAGDAIRFLELADKVDFREAVKRLKSAAGNGRKPVSGKKPAAPARSGLTVKDRKLLARVVAYYQHTFGEDTRGMKYLTEERGIRDVKAIEDFGVGFSNGTLTEILPEDEAILAALKRIGVLNSRGQEFFWGSVVFPMYDETGAVAGVYGRNIGEREGPGHLYLPGPRRGLINRQAVKRSSSVLLTESVIDALTLYGQGFTNVIPAYGVNGVTEEHFSLLNRSGVAVYVIFDADEAGRKGAQAVRAQLKEKGVETFSVPLPVKDVNDYFKEYGARDFGRLLKKASPGGKGASEKEAYDYEATDQGFLVCYGKRQYEVKGIQRGETQLKVTVKAGSDVRGNAPFELSTIDLYSRRSRVWFGKLCSDLFAVSEEVAREELGQVLLLAEKWRPKAAKPAISEATEAEKAEALRFLKNPDLLNEILADMETLGVTGEETNKLTGYLAAVSRKLDDPLSVLVQSRSAAGKSTLQDAVLTLVPEEDYVKYTRITDQALFYKDEESLVHKVLAIEEEAGMGGAGYSIRNIQSSKKITVAATGKDPVTGKMRTEEYTVKGPVCVMVTTTAAELEGETASRFLFLTVDESTEMTEAIHRKQREAETLEGLVRNRRREGIIKKHHTAQRLMRPLAVVNPFSKYLTYPAGSLRTRRDHKKYLGLIRALAFLFQYQREVKELVVEGERVQYIEVTLEDIERANKLAGEVLGQSLDELARPSRTLLSAVYRLAGHVSEKERVPLGEVYFSRRMIREYTGWSDWQVKAHIKQLEEMEYLTVRTGQRGKEYAYGLNWQGQGEEAEGEKFCLWLTSAAQVSERMKAEQSGPEG